MDIVDQLGRKVSAPDYARRIVSLVPSQTELLADLNLGDRVVGITRFCEHPKDWFYDKARIGGTKDPDLKRISALKPDLIIGNVEENTKEDIQKLEVHYPVWLSDVKDLDSAATMMRSIGQLTSKTGEAEELVEQILTRFGQLSAVQKPLRILYLIWQNPYMAAGCDTFIHSMIEAAGFENALDDPVSRYPVLTEQEIIELHPDLVFLSSEPYPFKNKHVEYFEHDLNTKAKMVDGTLFSWYGSRLVQAPAYFNQLQEELY